MGHIIERVFLEGTVGATSEKGDYIPEYDTRGGSIVNGVNTMI